MNKIQMSFNLNDQSVLLVPKSVKPKKAQSKYKSPEPSPAKLKKGYKRDAYNPCKENLDLSFQTGRHSKKNSVSTPLTIKPIDSISNVSDNASNLEDFIQKFHPALAQKNSESSRQLIEKLNSSNKNLKKRVMETEKEIAQKILENSNKITKNIQKTQNEIDALQDHFVSLQQKYKDPQTIELFQQIVENQETSARIQELKNLIRRYKENGIKHDQFFIVQNKIFELEKAQDILLNKNFQLKKELHEQQLSNTSDKAQSDYNQNLKSLNFLYSQIKKLESVAKKYLANENINMNDLFQDYEIFTEKSIPNLIAMIRKQIGSLRMIVSDIYAENCGNTCLNQ